MINKFYIKNFGEVTSTQDVVFKAAKQNKVAHGDVISAEKQTKGHGRYGRNWLSNSGNIFLTIVTKPTVEEKYWSQLSYVVGIAVAEAIIHIDPDVNVDLKWVNDILIDNKKVAGIILEKTYPDLLFIGIGINLIKDEALNQYRAISLEDVSNKFTKNKLIKVFLERFKNHYNEWIKNGFIPIKNLWMKRANAVGKSVTINFLDGNKQGVFIGINDYGSMQLLNQGKVDIINAGDMYFMEGAQNDR